MKAAQYNKYGGPEVIEVNEVKQPKSGSGQVLVKVYSASINPFDWKLRLGIMKEMILLTFPFTIGGDFSGTITEIGDGVSEFKIGDEVYGSALVLNGGSGSFAEFALVNTKNSAFKPKSITHVEAASLPLVGCSAIQGLEEHISLAKGQKIFINGGSGGIGSVAIQLAKHIGAYVAASASTKNIDFVKSLGADVVIDYTKESFDEVLKDYDAMFNATEEIDVEKVAKILKPNGIIVAMSGQPDEQLAKQKVLRLIRQSTNTNASHLSRLTELVEAGVVTPQVDKVFPLENIKEAFEYQETKHPKGKVVIKIDEGGGN